MFKSAVLAFGALIIASPALAQETDGLSEPKSEMVSYLQSIGFKDAAIASAGGDEANIVFEGLSGHRQIGARNDTLEIGKLAIAGLDAGYRWTKATTLKVDQARFTFGDQSVSADSILSINFGVLDIDSARPGLAFDSLNVNNLKWTSGNEPFVDITRLESKASKWYESYSLPSYLQYVGSVVLYPKFLASFDRFGVLPDPQRPVKANIDGSVGFSTSVGSATAKLAVETDRLGNHKLSGSFAGLDDQLLTAFFGLQDEALAGNPAKKERLQKDLAAKWGDVSIRTANYYGTDLEFVQGVKEILVKKTGQNILDVQKAVAGIAYSWLSANTSPEKVKAVVDPLYTTIYQFLANPSELTLEAVPDKAAKLGTFFPAADAAPQTTKIMDVLNVRASAH
jgi:hypothetical protein